MEWVTRRNPQKWQCKAFELTLRGEVRLGSLVAIPLDACHFKDKMLCRQFECSGSSGTLGHQLSGVFVAWDSPAVGTSMLAREK